MQNRPRCSKLKQKVTIQNQILNYMGNILLVGINYDKVGKEHTCRIEAYGKINVYF
ncbi:MAG: hypothetical protein ACLR8P_06920 [Clostridium fessum]